RGRIGHQYVAIARPDIIFAERVAAPAGLVQGSAMACAADKSAGPYGPCKRRRNCACEHHRGEVFFSPAETCGSPFVRRFDARPCVRLCQKFPPPRRAWLEDACLSTGIGGGG